MSKRLLLMTLFCLNAYAEPDSLPPIEDNSSYYGGTSSPTQAKTNNGNVAYSNRIANPANAMYEVLGQLEQLQKEVRQLSGTVEEQAHELAEMKKRQATLNEDMDQRLQSIEAAKATEPAAVPVVVPEAAPIPISTPTAIAEPANAAATPEHVPSLTDSPAVVTPPAAAPVSTNAGAEKFPQQIYPTAKAVTPIPASKSGEKEQYQASYDTLRDGHYSKAIASFNSLLTAFPNGEFSANAQYWLGEAHKVSQDIPAAREAFNKVITNYPTSPKVPDALLKLGYLELEQNNNAKAKEYLNKVSSGYPNTTAAHLAAKKLAALNGGLPQ